MSGLKKMWYTDVMEYHSALKKKGILLYATTWLTVRTLGRVK